MKKEDYKVGTGRWAYAHYLNSLVKEGQWGKEELLYNTLEDFIEEVAVDHGYSDTDFAVDENHGEIAGFEPKSCITITLPNYQQIQLTESGEYIYVYRDVYKTGGITWNGDDEYYDQYATDMHFAHKFDVENDVLVDLIHDYESVSPDAIESLAVTIINDCEEIMENWDKEMLNEKLVAVKKAVKK